MKAIILAGGSGERFWPLSTSKKPKQFLKIFSEKSLIRETFERLQFKLSPEDIFVVTGEKYKEQTIKELPEIPEKNVILEPIAKNTAPACFLGTLVADENEVVFILPADHYIPDKEKFWKTVGLAVKAAEEYNGLITLGIMPTRPETGYGYIESGELLEDKVMKVSSFKEKPDFNTAVEYLKKGNYFWNSGMFIWKKSVFIKEMELNHHKTFEVLKDVNPYNIDEIKEKYPKLEKISIDYALMEKSKNVYTVKAEFEWSDVGNWVSVREMEGYSDNKDNVYLVNSKNVFVKSNKNVGIVGLENIIVIDTENGLLISKETEINKIRDIVKQLKEKDRF
ncbi:mannose-1-phosphate guanylyltransferase [Marinitoga piezophila KA3]|uniref:mannose-1-phosphate guanylyltransferase n=1 Tax=Marinitoga piezophila (strain DSM 14283 / JCM 11233 / KA3) TaxID=443254 RepID=H2J7X4_MARPK|nr:MULTISPECIES: mannose-1-phosphate guanylyltransferase [Marinitoga]AEX85465.1 mannose-1-phosphate guanylyltransferase [Marinitoga piezophila KA3]APT75940.1 mannose-1-phosphate guanylyltransferase [Marinitoga sp. 1137]